MPTLVTRSQTFSPKTALETLDLGIGFYELAGSLVIRTGLVIVTVESGTDPNPSAILVGGAYPKGSNLFQRITGGILGVVYRLSYQATTANGQTFEEVAYLTIKAA